MRKAQPVHDSVVEGFPPVHGGIFRVAPDGRVYRLRRDGHYELTPQHTTSRGGKYFAVSYVRDGKQKNFLVHRLVAMAHIPNPENKPEVNHKDGYGHNNNAENLEWATRKENVDHALKSGLMRSLETRGIPCAECGSPTLSKESLCTTCKTKRRIVENTEKRRDEIALKILDRVDVLSEKDVGDRPIEMLKLRVAGFTLAEIGRRYGLTRERVRQILDTSLEIPSGKRVITDDQRKLSEYVADRCFNVSALERRLGFAPSKLSRSLSLKAAMDDETFKKVSEFVGFADQPNCEEKRA